MSKQFLRMVIGECVSAEQVREFNNRADAHVADLAGIRGFVSSQRLWELDGNMVVLETVWDSKGDCLLYHSSRAYRTFVQLTQHLLLGDFVIKLFERYSYTENFNVNGLDGKPLSPENWKR